MYVQKLNCVSRSDFLPPLIQRDKLKQSYTKKSLLISHFIVSLRSLMNNTGVVLEEN